MEDQRAIQAISEDLESNPSLSFAITSYARGLGSQISDYEEAVKLALRQDIDLFPRFKEVLQDNPKPDAGMGLKFDLGKLATDVLTAGITAGGTILAMKEGGKAQQRLLDSQLAFERESMDRADASAKAKEKELNDLIESMKNQPGPITQGGPGGPLTKTEEDFMTKVKPYLPYIGAGAVGIGVLVYLSTRRKGKGKR
jgi:hypothetical protein